MRFRGIYLALFCLIIFSIMSVSAQEQSLGTYQQRECIDLIQTCGNCTFVNVTSVMKPDSTITTSLVAMQQRSSTEFNYTYCDTDQVGGYIVNGFGNPDGEGTVFAYDFEITPSGFANTNNFFWLILILSLGIIILGFWLGDAPITIFGSFGLYFIAIYILFFGIAGIRDTIYTDALGIIILGLAMYISARSTYELITN